MGVDFQLDKLQNDLYGWITDDTSQENSDTNQKQIISEV